jgi:predicted nucleotidyltransferase
MPVRSLTSPVLRWPDAQAVQQAVRKWAEGLARERPEVLRIGYFGSYARGDWGVGSDLDVVIVVSHSDRPFVRRARGWDATELPVPTDVLVYTEKELEGLGREGRFARALRDEVRWVYRR